jgi:hypothetical protein
MRTPLPRTAAALAAGAPAANAQTPSAPAPGQGTAPAATTAQPAPQPGAGTGPASQQRGAQAGGQQRGPGAGGLSQPNADPFPSTYRPFGSVPTVIRNVTVMTAAGPTIQNGAVLLRDGKIASVGASVDVPPGAAVVDGQGKYLTPGIIDTHSHLGVYSRRAATPCPTATRRPTRSPRTSGAEHSVWPQDPQFPRNLAGGVTTLQVLPGSANLIGGAASCSRSCRRAPCRG